MHLHTLHAHRYSFSAIAAAAAALCCGAPAFAQGSPDESEAATLPEVSVTAPAGYDLREPKRRGSVGPLGERELIDTPYSISVLPAEQLQDQQLRSFNDATRTLPWVQADVPRPQTRGVQGAVIENSRADGFPITSTTDIPMELYEQVEVLNGVAGSLYGPATAAGMFSLSQKRARMDGRQSLTLGINSDGRPLAHADVWTPLTKDKRWRLRVNAVQESGGAYAPKSRIRRSLAGLALDGDLTERTRLEMNASYYEYKFHGLPGRFSMAAGVPFPAAIDPKRAGYGQRGLGDYNDTSTFTTRIVHEFGNGWRLIGGASRQIADREYSTVTNSVQDTAGNYISTAGVGGASRFTITSNQLSLQGTAWTGAVKHDLTIANNGFNWKNFNPADGATYTLGQANVHAPVVYPAPDWEWMDYTNRYRTAARRQQALILGDAITFNERWQLMTSLSYSWMHLTNYNRAGVTSKPSDSGASPFIGLVFKPTPTSSTYVSYADTLEMGGVAPAGAANEGQALSPYRSRQWEVGYKARVGRFDMSIAAFQIKRPFGYLDAAAAIDGKPLYHASGKQVNRGLEFGATGSLTRNLSITGGVAYLDARMKRTVNPASNNRRIVGLPRWSASVYADWRVPQVPGLSFNGFVRAISKRAADYANTSWVSGYATLDLGARYQHRLAGGDAVWRLTVNNVTDKRYWTDVRPGGWGYSGAGNAGASAGAPRSVWLTLQ